MGISRYDVMRQFTKGFCAAILPEPRSLSESDHWLAGWDAGYAYRAEKNRLLDEYLERTGRTPLMVIRPCTPHPTPGGSDA